MRVSLGLAVVAAAIAVTSACLTDPPPDLPATTEPPTIDHEQVQPPEGTTLTSLPASGFEVTIQLADPSAGCLYSVFDAANPSAYPYLSCQPCGSVTAAGTVTVDFNVGSAQFDPALCHRIEFVVASSFPDSHTCHLGTDVVIWNYAPPSCTTYDAGAAADGGFPADAAPDVLPVVPDSGDEP